jgi:hypothetical protein
LIKGGLFPSFVSLPFRLSHHRRAIFFFKLKDFDLQRKVI